MVFLLISGVLAIGYVLGTWHDAPDHAVREAMLEQRLERLARLKAQEQFARSWDHRR